MVNDRVEAPGAGGGAGPGIGAWRGSGPLMPGGSDGILAEMLSYAPDLRDMTGGRGDYTMKFDHYAQVPAHLAEKAAAAAA
jgi:Elongation factor G C-terminus